MFNGDVLKAKLDEICARYELSGGLGARTAQLVAVALQERVSTVLEALAAAGKGRANAARLAFGSGGVVRSTDPKQSWKQQQAAAAQRAAERAAAAGAANGHAAAGDAAAGGGGASAGGGAVAVSASDVLYVLDNEPQSSRSRVVQWWRCNAAPVAAHARQSTALFAPPPPTQGAPKAP